MMKLLIAFAIFAVMLVILFCLGLMTGVAIGAELTKSKEESNDERI